MINYEKVGLVPKLKSIFSYLCTSKYTGLYIAILGLLLSLLFVLMVYPRIADTYNAVLDTDRYGALGFGLWKNGSLSYYPDLQSTVNRGPVYPLFMATMLKVSNGWWPMSVQIAQCLLFSLTCFLVFWTAKTMWNQMVGLFVSLCCAVHPFLIWYTSRIWVETQATLLFTALVAGVLYFSLKPSLYRAVLVGILLAVASLCKQTFMPYMVIIPFLLAVLKGGQGRWRISACIFATAVILVSPWTLRNYGLTGRVIPVHLLAGFNFQVGDSFIDNFAGSPFSYAGLWLKGFKKVIDIEDEQDLRAMKLSDQEVVLDDVYLNASLKRYLSEPEFLARKIIYNLGLYWTLGETKLKSAVISCMQLPLLLLFICSTILILRRYGIRSIQAIPVIMVCCYCGFHLPIFAFARLSVVLIPTMLVVSGSLFGYCRLAEPSGSDNVA